MRRSLLLLASVAGAVVALDRWTKLWASSSLPFSQPIEVIGPYLRLTYTRNSGVAFGLGQGTGFPYYVFSIAAAVVILWMFLRRHVHGVRRWALALVFGGALGNLWDRLTVGEVVDFIEVGTGRWYWPVFNVADSAVTIGVILYALAWSRHEPRPAAVPAHEPHPGPAGPGLEQRGTPGPLPGGSADRTLP